MPEYPTSTADFSTRLTSLRAPRPRPRPRHSRVRTGCRECRERRVKCAEGEATSLGKMACRQCWETCSDCWYPDPDDRKQWVPALTTRQTPTAERLDLPDPEEERGQWLHDQATTDSIIAAAMDPSPGPGPHSHSSSRALSALFDSLHNSAVVIRTMAPSAVFQGQLLYPAPAIPLSTFTLAALSSATVDRAALSYFEVTGCNEIVAAPNSRSNWIYTVLFPRLYSLLSGSRPDHRGEAAVHDFVHHSLLRLSLVHRGNMEQNEEKAAEYKTQAARHRRAAVYATLKARMGYPEESWRTGIYLSGFFVQCMADMLGSEAFEINADNAFHISGPSTEYATGLRDMLAVYSTIHTVCSPHSLSRSPGSASEVGIPFELAPTGGKWVERFFGVTRPMVILIGQVNRLARNRSRLLRDRRESSLEGQEIRTEAENLLNALGSKIDFQDRWMGGYLTHRIERGTLVTRNALQIMLLCEVLGVELRDDRICLARSSAMELVADTRLEETAGYTWALSIAGIYCEEKTERESLRRVLKAAQVSSFGTGYRGADEVMSWCWEELDREGCYRDGIAPWREALSAAGRSMYV